MIIGVIAFTTTGCRLSRRVKEALEGEDVELWAKTKHDTEGIPDIGSSMREWVGKAFEKYDAIVFIGATGIAVREINPFIKSKDVDPAIVCMDEKGRFVISLLSGHIGGCNRLASRIAFGIGATPVITTATDINGVISIDDFAARNDMHICNIGTIKYVASRLLEENAPPVWFYSDIPMDGDVPKGMAVADSGDLGVSISYADGVSPFDRTLRLIPRRHVLGIGCRRNTEMSKIETLAEQVLSDAGVSRSSIRAVASIDLKKDEEGLIAYADSLGVPFITYSAEQLNSLENIGFSSSEMVKGVTGVDCVCERSGIAASRNGSIITAKTAKDGVTVALIRDDFRLSFGGS